MAGDLKETLERIVPSATMQADLAERAEAYHEQLFSPEGAEALNYLKVDRGWEESTIRHFKLGYVAKPYAIDRGMAEGRICIPHMNMAGYRCLRFRVVGNCSNGVPKYWQAPGSSVGLFNVQAINEPGETIVAQESEGDTMTLWQCGIPAVGFPGAQSIKTHHAYLFEGFNRVIISGDGDDAGKAFNQKLSGMVNNPVPITPPEGMDINDIYLQGGCEAVKELLGL